MKFVKNLGAKVYTAIALSVIGLLIWRIIDTKFIYHPPQFQSVLLLPEEKLPVWEASDSATLTESQATLSAQLSAQAYLVMEVNSRTVLVEKNALVPLPPASTTKLMTALTALDLFELNEIVEVSTQAAQENNGGGLFPHEQLTVRDLLIGLLVSSANDAAYALAEHAAGGTDTFMVRMNQLARELQLNQTLYQNPTGYDDPPNVTTARDLAVLSLQVLEDPQLVEWLGLQQAVVYNTAGNIRHFLFPTNELLGKNPLIIAGKTGTTDLAGEVLISVVKYQGRLILIIVIGSTDRYADTQILLNWLQYNLAWQ
ncbi:MAG: serine-type D-Ala-D-Ala carboxypeptidase [Candidatus Pacebacteria bacterium GW2011_GWA1_46_10]|nr:MAG: serine-type D-Ala-D-Ala carboxypeptidase [Candidatus Pacebacteria bacterium GW2011_GWA1_46_10]